MLAQPYQRVSVRNLKSLFNKKEYDFKFLDETEAESIKECKDLLDNLELKYSLTSIAANLDLLPATINKLKARGLKMKTALQLIEDVGRSCTVCIIQYFIRYGPLY